jgi:FdhE protein
MTEPQFSGPGTLDDIAPLRLPDPAKLFARRAERFANLAPGNTLGEYLQLLARLAQAQAQALQRISLREAKSSSVRPERGEAESKGALRYPLDASSHRRDPTWRDVLASIVGEMLRGDAPAETRGALELLQVLPPPEVEALADRVLANAVLGSDLASGPFAAAALQVYFAVLASRLPAAAVVPQREMCPVCASQPVVAVVLPDDKVRYLVCSLCATQWHHTRVECTVCHSGEAVSYYTLDRARQAAETDGTAEGRSAGGGGTERAAGRPSSRAEACARCKVYTKIFYTESDPALEPFADDVATLSLDLLMAEDGWRRHGVNLFLLPGEPKPPLAS